MSIDRVFSDDGKQLTIILGEKFDYSQVQSFRSAYSEGTEAVAEIVIDLQHTEYMDSSALGMLLNMQKAMNSTINHFKIIQAKPQVSRILQIARFDKKFEFC